MPKRLTLAGLVMSGLLVGGAADRTTHSQPSPRGFVEEMRIVSDEKNPAMLLTVPTDLITNEKGLLFTAHEKEGIVRVFDANGKYLRSFGRKGQGPGEFSQGYGFLATIGDTTIVYNYSPWSLAFFRSDGVLVRTITINTAPKNPLLEAYLPGDRALAQLTYWTGRGSVRDSIVFWMADAAGNLRTRLAVHADPPPGGRAGTPVEGFGSGQPFVASVVAVADPGGRRGLLIYPSSAFDGAPGQVKLVTINRDGVESERVVSLEARKLTSADVDALVQMRKDMDAEMNVMFAGRGMPTRVLTPAAERQLREQVTRPEYLPTVVMALAGRDGSLWVRSYWDRNDWSVISPIGAVVYKVHIPPTTRVVRVALDQFWAIATDSDGLPIITRNRVAAK
jgi:hypothetical protein